MKLSKTLIFSLIVVFTVTQFVLTSKQNADDKGNKKTNALQYYTYEGAIDLLKNIYKGVFNDGETVKENSDFKKNYYFCIRHFEDGFKETNEPKLKQFFSDCFKYKNTPENFKSELLKETIIDTVFAETFVVDQKTYGCGNYLEEKLLKKILPKELKSSFDKAFEGLNEYIPQEKFISSMYNQHREKLRKGSFEKMNKISRGEAFLK